MAKQWDTAAALRNDFADMVEGLTDEQLDAPTICGTWTTRHILGHLVVFVDVALPKFFLNMVRAGFSYDKAADSMARAQAERPVAELVATLRAKAGKASAMGSFPEELTIADVAIHTQDVRRSLDLDGALSRESVRTVLAFLASHKAAKNIYDPSVIEGLHLETTDLDWRHGTGACVEGPAEALMMALAGRPTLDALQGNGLETLRERLS